MSERVLLTDEDDSTMLVECSDREEAERVARAAVWSNGGVSAWIVPDEATPVSGALIAHLTQDMTLWEVSTALGINEALHGPLG